MLLDHGLYGHAQRNVLISLTLLGTFIALLMLVLTVLGLAQAAAIVSRCMQPAAPGQIAPCLSGLDYAETVWRTFVASTPLLDGGWLHALMIGLAWVVANVWWSSLAVRYETGARRIERRDAPELHAMVETLAITAGLLCPHIEIVDRHQLNAYASGFTPSQHTIGLTRGLVETLPRGELEAVIAHEIAHIKLGHVRLMAVAKACSDLSFVFAKVMFETAARPLRAVLAVCALVLILGPVGTALSMLGLLAIGGSSLLFKAMISRSRELVADATAVDLMRDPVALASALRRIGRNDVLPGLPPSTRAMMFTNSALSLGLATHPPLEARVAALMRHASVTENEIAQHRRKTAATRPVRPVQPPLSTARPRADRKSPDWIERWLLSGRADRHAKRVIRAALLIPILLPVLLVLPGILLYVLVVLPQTMR